MRKKLSTTILSVVTAITLLLSSFGGTISVSAINETDSQTPILSAVGKAECINSNSTMTNIESDAVNGYAPVNVTFDYAKAFEVLEYTNQERIAQGLAPLKMDKDLIETAMLRAAETSIYFDHERPDGTMCYTASSKMNGENIAAGYGTPNAVVVGWMNSTGHRANILRSSFQCVGIGVAVIDGIYYWSQCFGNGTASVANAESYSTSPITKDMNIAFNYTSTSQFSPKAVVSSSTIYCGKTGKAYLGINNTFVTAPLSPSGVTYKSSDPSVISVSADGTLTALKPGSATITMTLKSNTSISVTTNVSSCISLSDAEISIDNSNCICDGTEQKPIITITYNGNTLKENSDYTLSYSNNIDYGYGWVYITGMGGYSGSISKYFLIQRPTIDTVVGYKFYTRTSNSIGLTWDKVDGANGYYVYRYDGNSSERVLIATTSENHYFDTNLSENSLYKYGVVAFKEINSKIYASYSYYIYSAYTTTSASMLVTIGDANNDSMVTVADIVLCQRALAKNTNLTEQQKYALDINNDGKITTSDAVIMSKYILGYGANYDFGYSKYVSTSSKITV